MKINQLIAFSLVISPVAVFSLKADINGSLANWNVITTGDAYLNDTVAGRIFVGGNLNYGNQVASGEGSVANTNITLAVAGNTGMPFSPQRYPAKLKSGRRPSPA